MSNFDQLILSINSRIGHEKDLAFSKNNGEIANRIRAKFLAGADIERTPRVWNIVSFRQACVTPSESRC